MQNCKNIPEIIRTAIKEDWTHVFLIGNPVVGMVARMAIEQYGIDHDKIQCVSIRETDTRLVSSRPIKPYSRWYDRALVKFFCDSPIGRRIAGEINKKKDNIILYASWLYPEAETVASSPYCKGHVYLEEGQMSYYQSCPYARLGNDKRRRKKKILMGNINYYFREDASAYIGLSARSFPMIEQKKRFILDNFDTVRLLYTPRLNGVKTIGLMPAPRRIPQEYLETALGLLIEKMPEGGVIKLHPAFGVYPVLKQKIASIMERISNGSVALCDDNVIVELEMLSEPKVVIGARCSLSEYTELFGSKYEFVQFNGYIPPKN